MTKANAAKAADAKLSGLTRAGEESGEESRRGASRGMLAGLP